MSNTLWIMILSCEILKIIKVKKDMSIKWFFKSQKGDFYGIIVWIFENNKSQKSDFYRR